MEKSVLLRAYLRSRPSRFNLANETGNNVQSLSKRTFAPRFRNCGTKMLTQVSRLCLLGKARYLDASFASSVEIQLTWNSGSTVLASSSARR